MTDLQAACDVVLAILTGAGIKSVAILTVTWGAALLMRRRSAAAGHAVWVVAVASLLVLPLLSAALPVWRALPTVAFASSPPVTDGPVSTDSHAAARDVRSSEAMAHLSEASSLGYVPSAPRTPAEAGSAWVVMWVVGVWVLGAIACLTPLLLGTLNLLRVRRHAAPVTDGDWQRLLDDCRARLGVRRRVILLQSNERTMPMTWGALPWAAAKLLIPEETQWRRERRRVVLLHELAHIKRWDCLTQLVTQVACAAYWFNPLVWLAARRVVIERERACDDLVLHSDGTRPADYAEHLLHIATHFRGRRFIRPSAIAMARVRKHNPSGLEGRLVAILDGARNRGAMTLRMTAAAVVIAALLVVPLAMLGAGEDERAPVVGPPAEAGSVEPRFVYLMGATPRPGAYGMPDTEQGVLTVLQLLASSGFDVAKDDNADLLFDLVRRTGDNRTTRERGIAIRDLVSGEREDVELQANDLIILYRPGEEPDAEAAGTGAAAEADASETRELIRVGHQIYSTRGCTACHSVDGSKGIGSTFKGLFGSQLRMADGQTLRVDADFIRASVRDPGRHITEGYQNVMPKFAMSDSELDALVAYIRSIGNPQAASPVDVGHGSVVTLIVRDDGAGRDMFVDFDTGRLFTPPEGLDKTDAEAVLGWIKESGVDAMAETAINVHRLVGFDLVAQPTRNERLTGATHGMFEADQFRLATPGKPVFLSAKGELPQTWLFETREGGRGLIQIVDFVDDGVRVRVRLIERGENKAPTEVHRRIERMRQALLGVRVYAEDHEGQWPDDLDAIRPYVNNAKWLDVFTYMRPRTPPGEANGKVPLLTERSPVVPGWRIVGYADGHVGNHRVDAAGNAR